MAPLSTPLPPFVVVHPLFMPLLGLITIAQEGEEMANNAKALLSAWMPPSLLHSVVCTAAVVAIMQEGKEQPKMPSWHCLLLCRHVCVHSAAIIANVQAGVRSGNNSAKAPCSAPPPSLAHTVIHAAAINATAETSKE
jgi:hypothetical protein